MSSRVGSFEWIVGTNSMRWSEDMFSILGYNSDVTPHLDLIRARSHGDDAQRLEAALALVLEGGTEIGLEQRLNLPDGGIRPVRIIARAQLSALPHVVGQLIDLTPGPQDIAEAARLAASLLQSRCHVQAAQDLRQPLTAVTLYARTAARWLTRDPPDVGEACRALAGILSASAQAQAILQTMVCADPERPLLAIPEQGPACPGALETAAGR